MLERRILSLRRCFQLVALSVCVPGTWLACSARQTNPSHDTTSPDGSPEGAAPDAPDDESAGSADDGGDGGSGGDAGEGGDGDATVDGAPVVMCNGAVVSVDAGPDAEELCLFASSCPLSSARLTAVGCQVVPEANDGAPMDPASVGFPICNLVEGMGCADGGYTPTEAGESFLCIGCPGGGGRRPAGFELDRSARASVLGAYFAELTQLEAGAAQAFAILASELAAYGAPDPLVDAARASAADEVRHASMMARISSRFGVVPPEPKVKRIRRTRGRSLAEFARENAIEGCVRETFGALLNGWQAVHAEDAEVRRVMAAIARDEERHAALAWEIAAWSESVLSASARRSIARSRQRVIGRLAAAADGEASPALRALVGLPSGEEARRLVRGLAERLWAA